MKTMVSIIVTCYNQEQYIKRTLESVIIQTFAYWECIIVDDGSTDNSANVIKETVGSDERFRYVYQENAGVSKARNTGFILSKGNYINFLDGDDTIFPQKLEQQLMVFEQNPEVAICLCKHQFYYEDKQVYAQTNFELLNKNPLEQILFGWHNNVSFTNHAPLYKKSLWSDSELPYPIEYHGRCEDWVFNVIVALKNQPYYYLESVLCNYHIAQNGFTSNHMNLVVSAIKAAVYLNPLLPKQYQSNFLDNTIKNNINLFVNNERVNILKSSRNWRIANMLTKPFFKVVRIFKIK